MAKKAKHRRAQSQAQMVDALDALTGTDSDAETPAAEPIQTPRTGSPPTLVRVRLRRAWGDGAEYHAVGEVLLVEAGTANRLVDAGAADWE